MIIQRNFFFIALMAALFGISFLVVKVAALSNSRTFEPYVIEVDKKTNIVTQVSSKSVVQYKADEAVIRASVVQYIRAREGYDYNTYRYNYNQIVRLFSAGDVYRKFNSIISSRDKDSVISLGRERVREVAIKSITFLQPRRDNKVQVRITLSDYDRMKTLVRERNVIITLSYNFLELDLSPYERYINPLGFQIVGYTTEQEGIDG